MNGMDIKTFTYKHTSKQKLVINKYIEYINDYRTKLGIKGYFGIRFSGHSSGGAIAAGIIYMIFYKMLTLSKIVELHPSSGKTEEIKENEKMIFKELKDIFKQSRAYSYGAPRTFDTNTGIVISYIDKLYNFKKIIDSIL